MSNWVSCSRLLVPLSVGCGAANTAATAAQEGPLGAAADPPEGVARTYFQALEAGDTDGAGRLFARQSSIFETGSVEGSWAHYLEHHLRPELQAVQGFETRLGKPFAEASGDGSLAWVAWPLEYDIHLADGGQIASRGTMTFVLLQEGGEWRIRHLHRSSRRRKPASEGH